jgi:hypothetical protein
MPAFREDRTTAAVASPLDLVRGLFASADQHAGDRADDWGVEEFFTNLLKDPVIRDQVSRKPSPLEVCFSIGNGIMWVAYWLWF